jgi:hypothetical protein
MSNLTLNTRDSGSRCNGYRTGETVRISVIGGVAYVNHVPHGLTVEVTDYDVEPGSPINQVDEDGKVCARWLVRESMAREAAL